MKHLKAEIVAVGTELLLGQISNTNAQWLSQKLSQHGISVFFHSVVGDNLERVKQTFKQAGSRSDIVFVTGGLGPTDDDMTREAFQSLTGRQLKEDQEAMDKISAYFRNAKRTMTPNNRKQARVFEGAKVLKNTAGMAPGMIVEEEEVTWIFMPGVPREMKQLSIEQVFPYLVETYQLNTVIHSRMLRFTGIGESQLEHQLKNLIDGQTNPTIAPLAYEGEVAIRLTASATTKQEADKLIDETEKKILESAGPYFFGYDEETIEQKVIERLNVSNQTIAAAESLTGGRFTDLLVSVPGASQVINGGIVSYATKVKINHLGISEQLINKYGTVSSQCAEAMAENVRDALKADIGISFTGVAGPDQTEGKEPGTVFIGIAEQGKTVAQAYHFSGDRNSVRKRAVKKGLEILHRHLASK
ncbi:competence/damage-inducible protein A [Sediminibacillus massiliensis]|uniref:competence/damage-inducible protein A n=1 Tax=Sediminibacillus massiliensis TaxID=1926277 RepID=UPI00098889AA|nr:competence/damage-inducible protein A [Sediminibacillus massiliensis]